MNNVANDAQEMLRLLREGYIARLPEKFNQIELSWQILQQSGWETEPARKMHGMVHKLAGSGASYGFPVISQAARSLEIYLEEMLENPAAHAADWPAEIKQLLADLEQAIADPEV